MLSLIIIHRIPHTRRNPVAPTRDPEQEGSVRMRKYIQAFRRSTSSQLTANANATIPLL